MQDNRAGFSLVVAGTDFAKIIVPRLVSLSITEKLEDAADELEVVLANHPDKDGKTLSPINRGAFATLELGWTAGREVPIGLVGKGRFKVDEVRKAGGGAEGDTLTIRARSADLAGNFRNRRDRGWKGKTIAAVVGEIASANGYVAKVHPDLAGIAIQSVEQAAKSDMAFIRDIGRRYDAIATVKDRTLLFLPIGTQTNAGGTSLPGLTLRRQDNSSWSFTVADREDHDGAEAQWQDRKSARRKTVTTGGGKNPRRIKRNFASEAEAREAAKAEARRTARGQFTFEYTMALGDAAMVAAVAEVIEALSAPPPLVVDPVMVAKGGARLLDEDAIGTVKARLLPLATLVTPNTPELGR